MKDDMKDVKVISLSSGATVEIYPGKGKDLFNAMALANSPWEIAKLLITMLCKVNGKKITENDLDEMPLGDVVVLIREVSEQIPFTVQK